MYKVRKRDGKIVNFDINKIGDAITKAFEAENKNYDSNVIDFLALKVTADFEPKVKNNIIAINLLFKNRVFVETSKLFFENNNVNIYTINTEEEKHHCKSDTDGLSSEPGSSVISSTVTPF